MNRRRRNRLRRVWQRKRHKCQMLWVSNAVGPCPEPRCGHRHWPCGSPDCNDIGCGGPCRQPGCPCMAWGQWEPRKPAVAETR